MDLYSLVFEVQRPTGAQGFHHVLWAMIALVDPRLAQTLHLAKGYKPYSVSPLMQGQHPAHHNVESGWVRVASLTPRLTSALLTYQERYFEPGQVLEQWQLERLDRQSPWAALTDYRTIYTTTAPLDSVRFQVVTPTAFSRPHDQQPLLLPYPALIFRNLYDRWMAFCDLDLADGEADITLSQFEVQTQALTVFGVPQRGFVGQVTLHAQTRQAAQSLGCLSQFALFSGVGSKTAGGMGMVR